MPMKLYNTLTRKVDELKTHEKNKVRVYTCGPTVYSYQHIGNLSCYVREDILIKSLSYLGYDVFRVMNITDVGHLTSDSDSGDDKMVKSAKQENKTVLAIAKFYTDLFFEDFKKLNLKMPDIVSPATEYIDEIIKIVSALLEKGFAYISGGNVYFDTSKKEDYYKLTNNKEDELVVGFRESVETDSNKRNQADFVLWFTKSKFDSQELKWVSPWGLGYPGWHMECSAISIKELGEYLDIHCGGVDHIFPHHTNEIAQSESYLGHPWCNHWVHMEFLNNKEGKISKSKGDKLTVTTLEEKGYNPLAFKLMCLNSPYRKELTFSYEILGEFNNTYKKLKTKTLSVELNGELEKEIFNNYNNRFKEFLMDDLNMSNVLTLLYELLKDDKVNGTTKIELINSFDKVLGLDLLKEDILKHPEEELILSKINERNEYKKNKQYDLADKIRLELEEKGIVLKDTREGTTWSLKE